jgi:hypothetical protein
MLRDLFRIGLRCLGLSARHAALVVLLLLFAVTASASPPATQYVKADSLNVRDAPKSGKIMEKRSRGDRVTVYAESQGWSRISADGAPERWVADRFLCPTSGCATAVASPSHYTPRPSTPRSTPRYYDSGSGCPCSGSRNCIGPRGGRYCITSGGNKRYR